MRFLLLILPLLLARCGKAAKSKRQQLIEELFSGYNYTKPAPDCPIVAVTFGVQHVYFPYEDSPVAVMLCTVAYTWIDRRLKWNPMDFDGITKLTLPTNHKLWKPQCMTNMDGRNHRMAERAHFLKGFDLEVKNARRSSAASITMHRRVEIEAICEKETSFPTILKCQFHGTSKEDVSVVKWVYTEKPSKVTDFMEGNTTGTGAYDVVSVKGLTASNYYNPRKQFNEISVCVRLRESGTAHAVLATLFLSALSALTILLYILPPSSKYLNSFTYIVIFLLLVVSSQLVTQIKTYSAFAVPAQTRVFAFLFALATLVLPFQHLLGCAMAKEKSDWLLQQAQRIPPFKELHTKMFPYTKDFELPFMYVFLKTLVVLAITIIIAVLFVL